MKIACKAISILRSRQAFWSLLVDLFHAMDALYDAVLVLPYGTWFGQFHPYALLDGVRDGLPALGMADSCASFASEMQMRSCVDSAKTPAVGQHSLQPLV